MHAGLHCAGGTATGDTQTGVPAAGGAGARAPAVDGTAVLAFEVLSATACALAGGGAEFTFSWSTGFVASMMITHAI